MTQQRLTNFFETLTSDVSLEDFKEVYAQNVHFRDPFHNVTNVGDVYEIFQQMFKRLDSPTFRVIEYIGKENVGYIKWRFIFKFKGENALQSFVGVSRIMIDKEDKISEHVDFWDAGEHIYGKLPLLGTIIRWIKQKIQNGLT